MLVLLPNRILFRFCYCCNQTSNQTSNRTTTTGETMPQPERAHKCRWCGDSFDPDSNSRRLRHVHGVFRRPMRDSFGQVHRISGSICCFCRNWERASVSDEFMSLTRDALNKTRQAVTEPSDIHHYPTGNMRLIVFEPGRSKWVKSTT